MGCNADFVLVFFTSSPDCFSFVLVGCNSLWFSSPPCDCSSYLFNAPILSVFFSSLILVAGRRATIL